MTSSTDSAMPGLLAEIERDPDVVKNGCWWKWRTFYFLVLTSIASVFPPLSRSLFSDIQFLMTEKQSDVIFRRMQMFSVMALLSMQLSVVGTEMVIQVVTVDDGGQSGSTEDKDNKPKLCFDLSLRMKRTSPGCVLIFYKPLARIFVSVLVLVLLFFVCFLHFRFCFVFCFQPSDHSQQLNTKKEFVTKV